MRLSALICGIVMVAAAAGAAQTQPARAPQAFALVVSGNPGSPVYARRFADWLTRFHAYATGPAGMPKDNVVVLNGDKDFKSPVVTGPATAEAVKKSIADLSRKMTPADQFVLVIMGHGAIDEANPMLLLPGPDLSAKELAEALDAVPAENQVVLNFAGASGDFVKALARRGRVQVSATSPAEEGEPVLCEFFLMALETKSADGEAPLPLSAAEVKAQPSADPAKPTWRTGKKDGQVSILEACNWATHETAMWTMRQKKDGEQWVVEGKRSFTIFKKLCAGDDKDPGARKLSPNSDASAADAVMPLKMKDGADIDQWWIGRRAVQEHAQLEDCGQDTAVSCLRGIGYEPLDGLKDGQPGFLARRIVIGRPALLPEEGK